MYVLCASNPAVAAKWNKPLLLLLYNSAADCSILLKFGTAFDHVTADTLRTFTVIGSEVKVVTYQQ